MVRVDEIAARLGLRVGPAAGMVGVNDVEHDSRRVGSGTLFACIPGAVVDGHDFAAAATAAGATALLVERELALDIPQLVVPSVREAIGPVAALVHGEPSRTIDVVGVTGTNGKTTTVRIVASLLTRLGWTVTEIGTLTGKRTTPEAPELQRQFAAASAAGHHAVIMEVSSHALDQHRVDGTRFRVAAFTNLGADHLDHHGTMEAYFDAKALLFRPELSDLAIVDTTTEAGDRLARSIEIPVVVTGPQAVTDVVHTAVESRFRWRDRHLVLPLAGAFNVTNARIAAEIVVALGFEPDAIAAALSEIDGVPGRFETIDAGQDFGVIVDFAHTPDGLEAALHAARDLTTKTLTVVFGAGGDRDQGKRPQMGEVARRLADRVVITSDNPRNESPEAIISAIVSGMSHPPELIELDRQMAIRHAIAGAREGDLVLIAGKGHEPTQTIGDDVLDFDDREVARKEVARLRGFDA